MTDKHIPEEPIRRRNARAMESLDVVKERAKEGFVPAWDDYTHADEHEDAPRWSDDDAR